MNHWDHQSLIAYMIPATTAGHFAFMQYTRPSRRPQPPSVYSSRSYHRTVSQPRDSEDTLVPDLDSDAHTLVEEQSEPSRLNVRRHKMADENNYLERRRSHGIGGAGNMREDSLLASVLNRILMRCVAGRPSEAKFFDKTESTSGEGIFDVLLQLHVAERC